MSTEEFNAHQQDVRSRVNSLARAVFILAGGALSISIGIFSNTTSLSECITHALQISWWLLTLSILSLVATLFSMIVRDYCFGERWRDQIDGKIERAENNNKVVEAFLWLLGTLGLIFFMLGFFGLAYVATSFIGST